MNIIQEVRMGVYRVVKGDEIGEEYTSFPEALNQVGNEFRFVPLSKLTKMYG